MKILEILCFGSHGVPKASFKRVSVCREPQEDHRPTVPQDGGEPDHGGREDGRQPSIIHSSFVPIWTLGGRRPALAFLFKQDYTPPERSCISSWGLRSPWTPARILYGAPWGPGVARGPRDVQKGLIMRKTKCSIFHDLINLDLWSLINELKTL